MGGTEEGKEEENNELFFKIKLDNKKFWGKN